MVVVTDMWSLFGGGRLLRFDCIMQRVLFNYSFNQINNFIEKGMEADLFN